MEILIKRLKSNQKEILELKITITELKNLLELWKSRYKQAEERIMNLKNRTIKRSEVQNEQKKFEEK